MEEEVPRTNAVSPAQDQPSSISFAGNLVCV